MTKKQITRTIGKMSNEQREHLAEQIKLRALSARFMGKPIREDKLKIALCAIEGKARR